MLRSGNVHELLTKMFYRFAAEFLVLLYISCVAGASLEASCTKKSDNEKIDCYPNRHCVQESCEALKCCWEPVKTPGVPWCFYPDNYGGYLMINKTHTDHGMLAFYRRDFPSGYPEDIQIIRVEVEHQTKNRVRIKVTDAVKRRYESPYPRIKKETFSNTTLTYDVALSHENVGIKVVRNDGDVLFDSSKLGSFIFSNQYLQLSTTFDGMIYGLGEHRTTFWLDTNWTRYTLFTHDAAPQEGINLYGSHPFYLVQQQSGKSYGVFLHNSNAMDVLLQPLPAITFRAIGGIFDFYVFTGPTPADVIRQYTELIGRPFMPPYWSLGFHLCKYGYGSEEVTRAVWKRNRDAGIPFDVMWNDIDYMNDQNDFTIDEVNFGKLPELVEDIHKAGMHYVPILDPGVSASEPRGTYPPYDDGVAMDIFVKDHKGEIFIGKVWNPNTTAFPDFTNPKTQEYWTKHIRELREKLDFDGLWIDMNEPANFWDGGINGCPDDDLENPFYTPGVNGGILRKKTFCMTAKQYAGLHYDVHNLYGISEHEMTYRALRDITGKRVFTLSRSTFPGSGYYGGHWSGDVFSTWHDLTKSVPEMLSYSLFGMAFTGADICGFIGNATKSLCNRWMQLGAFYPFSRNHNSIESIHQDPAAFGREVIQSSTKALKVRYTLLPYLYTLFYQAHVHGDTVVRPLFFEFPEDANTYKVDRSFLWGPGLYIVPVTEDSATRVKTYLPKGKWYDWYNTNIIVSSGKEVILNAPSDTIPLLVREGVILPTQKPERTTTLSRKNEFTYYAFARENCTASGSLFWDDGISLDTIETGQYGLIDLTLSNDGFKSKVKLWQTPDNPMLNAVIIRGFSRNIKKVLLNGKEIAFQLKDGVLTVSKLNIPLKRGLEITWE